MKEIEIIIDEETGEIQLETMCGITGISCEEILDKLQEAMQAQEISHEDKPERYEPVKITEKQAQKRSI